MASLSIVRSVRIDAVIERFHCDVGRVSAAEEAEIDRDPARRRLVRRGHHRRPVRLAIGQDDQPSTPLARDERGRQANRAAEITALGVDRLHETARLAQLLRQSFNAWLAAVRDDADAVARRALLLEELDDLEHAAAAVCRHRA
jgi:hypothetical protein